MDCRKIPSKKLIIMKFGTKEEQEKIKSLIDARKIANCDTKLATKLDPTIRITNIHDLSEEDIINGIRNVTGKEPVGVNIVQRAKTRRAFIRLKKIDYETLMMKTPNELYSYVGFLRLRYELFISVSKCRECLKMGHTSETCRNKENSELKTIGKKAEEANKCANCTLKVCRNNDSKNLQSALDRALEEVTHYSFHYTCETYKTLHGRTLKKYNL